MRKLGSASPPYPDCAQVDLAANRWPALRPSPSPSILATRACMIDPRLSNKAFLRGAVKTARLTGLSGTA